MSCVIEGCKSHSSRKENIAENFNFHRFPKNEEQKKIWIRQICRLNWTPTKHSRICSKHFTPDSYSENADYKQKRLKEGAIPTLHLPDGLLEPLSGLPPGNDTDAGYRPKRLKLNPEGCCNNFGMMMGPLSDLAPENDTNARHTSKGIQPNPDGYCNVSNVIDESVGPLSDLATGNDTNASRNSKGIKSNSDGCCSINSDFMRTEDYKKKIKMLEKELDRVNKISKRRLRKINALTKRITRVEKKNRDIFNILIEKLREEDVESEYITMMENISKNEVVKRFLQKLEGDTLTREYSLEIKKFAVSLHYLSPRAYTFVREQFLDVLPHPKTLSSWYQGMDCSPGFTSEAFQAIRLRAEENPNKVLFCALAIDEMAIRKLIEWDSHNHKYYGYVNFGCDLDSDSAPEATQALTFMLTCLNDTWKIPVGYFLIKSIRAQQKSMLVQQCIQLLQECGVVVTSLTFDGAASNVSMCKLLGCDTSSGSSSFQCGDSEVFLWPDPCHNIKLVRNAFADKQCLVDAENRRISWEYIKLLVKLQQNEGLHLGNKLKKEHVDFIKQKMKVRLAAQLFSNSVADALEYCREKGIPGFENCEGTITFIRIFNNLFDICNSRNMRAKGWKRALASFNIQETEIFFESADLYIRNLKMLDGTYLINSNRKTGFTGFLICMKSLIKMYHNVVTNNALQYLCTYKLSQDHIELFFGAIRAKCGFNNNPSARMFQAAYKKLLVHAQFKDGSSGNCVPLEKITVLNYTSKKPIDAINQSSGNVRIVCNDNDSLIDDDIDNTEPTTATLPNVYLDHDYCQSSSVLTEYSTDVVHYIAGFVVSKLNKTLKCETCIESLCDYSPSDRVSLISLKDRGGLTKPSKDVFKICEAIEKIVREHKSTVGEKLIGQRKNVMFIINKVRRTFIHTSIFDSLSEHSGEQDFDNNHSNLLMKAICQLYLKTRIHHMTKQICPPSDKVRNHLTKYILFQGQ